MSSRFTGYGYIFMACSLALHSYYSQQHQGDFCKCTYVCARYCDCNIYLLNPYGNVHGENKRKSFDQH